MRSLLKFMPGSILLGLALCTATAGAQTPSGSTAPAKTDHAVVVAGLGRSVDTDALARLEGGTDISEQITLNGTMSDTTTEDVGTGFNSIDGSAFSNAVGVPMVIQNSGNSVLIQNATIIDIQFQQ
jgi:hypothetical protein